MFPAFVEATITALPPQLRPRACVRRLTHAALRCVGSWARSHGSTHRQVALAERYLRETRGMDIPLVDGPLVEPAPTPREAALRAERARNLLARYDRIDAEIAQLAPQIDAALAVADECFAILVPNLEGPADAPPSAHKHARAAEGGDGDDDGDVDGDEGDEGEETGGDATGGEETGDEETGDEETGDERGASTSGCATLRSFGITSSNHAISLSLPLSAAGADRDTAVLDVRRENSALADALHDVLLERMARVVHGCAQLRLGGGADGDGNIGDRNFEPAARRGGSAAAEGGSGTEGGTESGTESDFEEGVPITHAPPALAAAAAHAGRAPLPQLAAAAVGERGARRCCGVPRRDGSLCAEVATDRCPFHGPLDLALAPGADPRDERAQLLCARTPSPVQATAATPTALARAAASGAGESGIGAGESGSGGESHAAAGAGASASVAGAACGRSPALRACQAAAPLRPSPSRAGPSARERLGARLAKLNAARPAGVRLRQLEAARDEARARRFANDVTVAWRG
ncbi:hypothetical protein KFE25_010930 [Diacronema lutheri]|uniref:Uncharacterized protein n=1 Tax=Diacronema lutheri TaxID=2081491 RepID=A0A8J5X3D0_DIALT|nr:hypothetical protein KFE25_010930 [Diacronema lutheri]